MLFWEGILGTVEWNRILYCAALYSPQGGQELLGQPYESHHAVMFSHVFILDYAVKDSTVADNLFKYTKIISS